MENIKKELLGIKISISEMKNILDRINGRLKNAKEKLVEHENTD